MTSGEAGIAYAVGLFYLTSHFLFYVLKLRRLATFQTERGIFLYHFVSALLFVILSLVICTAAPNDATIATAFGLVATHGIYSISFLELWSLAQGSYSISIVTGSASGTGVARDKLIATFARIGDEKKSNRLCALVRSSLVERFDHSWQLTGRGHFLAMLVAGLLWLVDIKKAG